MGNKPSGPSAESLREIPEIDFSNVRLQGRGLYAHLLPGNEDDSLGRHSGRFVVRIPSGLHRALAAAAEQNGVSLNMFVATALAHAIGALEGQ
jgi:hypothetical protein